jgi:hypothetical protein
MGNHARKAQALHARRVVGLIVRERDDEHRTPGPQRLSRRADSAMMHDG